MVLSNAQITALLQSPSSPYPVTLRIIDSPPAKGREFFPRVQVENVQPELTSEDYKIKEISQNFKCVLHYRVGATATGELANVKLIQNIIRTTLQNATLAGSKLFKEVFNWTQIEYVEKPVRHIETSISVTANDILSETGAGLIGAYTSFTMSSKTVIVLSSTGDEGRNYSRPSDDSGNSKVVGEDTVGTQYLEYEYVKATFDAFATAITNKAEISATLTENGNNRVMTVIPVRQRSSVRYDGLKTTILQIEIVSG